MLEQTEEPKGEEVVENTGSTEGTDDTTGTGEVLESTENTTNTKEEEEVVENTTGTTGTEEV